MAATGAGLRGATASRLRVALAAALLALTPAGCSRRPAAPAPQPPPATAAGPGAASGQAQGVVAGNPFPAGDPIFGNRVAQLQQELGVPVQIISQAPLPGGGAILFFRYARGDKCGFGQLHVDAQGLTSGSSYGEYQCNQPPVLGLMGLTSTDPENPANSLVATYGEINDPRIVRVVVTLRDGQTLPAQVAGGAWFLFFPGQTRPPEVRQVIGFDTAGAPVATAP